MQCHTEGAIRVGLLTGHNNRSTSTVAADGDADPTSTLPSWATEMVLLGCQGGAGTSTLRVLLDTPWELGAYSADRSEIGTFGRPLLLVTRDNAAAAARCSEVVTSVTANGIEIAAVAVMADGSGPEPKESTTRFRLLQNRVGGIVRVPFVAGLRYVDLSDVGRVALPKKFERALSELRFHCHTFAVQAQVITTDRTQEKI